MFCNGFVAVFYLWKLGHVERDFFLKLWFPFVLVKGDDILKVELNFYEADYMDVFWYGVYPSFIDVVEKFIKDLVRCLARFVFFYG